MHCVSCMHDAGTKSCLLQRQRPSSCRLHSTPFDGCNSRSLCCLQAHHLKWCMLMSMVSCGQACHTTPARTTVCLLMRAHPTYL